MKCRQCGLVSCLNEASIGHCKAVHFTFLFCNVCGEMEVFLTFFSVPSVNILLSRDKSVQIAELFSRACSASQYQASVLSHTVQVELRHLQVALAKHYR